MWQLYSWCGSAALWLVPSELPPSTHLPTSEGRTAELAAGLWLAKSATGREPTRYTPQGLKHCALSTWPQTYEPYLVFDIENNFCISSVEGDFTHSIWVRPVSTRLVEIFYNSIIPDPISIQNLGGWIIMLFYHWHKDSMEIWKLIMRNFTGIFFPMISSNETSFAVIPIWAC